MRGTPNSPVTTWYHYLKFIFQESQEYRQNMPESWIIIYIIMLASSHELGRPDRLKWEEEVAAQLAWRKGWDWVRWIPKRLLFGSTYTFWEFVIDFGNSSGNQFVLLISIPFGRLGIYICFFSIYESMRFMNASHLSIYIYILYIYICIICRDPVIYKQIQ
jgi:hypothetical protein